MSADEELIFDDSGWEYDQNLIENAKKYLSQMKLSRENKANTIFSLLDSEDDIQQIIEDSEFFTNSESKTSDLVLVGTGGSSLGANALIKTNINKNSSIGFHVLDSLDPISIRKILNKISPKNSKFLVISKSGKTTEIIALVTIILEWLKNNKVEINKSMMCMYDHSIAMGSPLENICAEYGLKTSKHKSDIGGRFSVLSATGLLPATIMGIDPRYLRNIARQSLNKSLNDNKFILSSSLFARKGINKDKLNCVINYGDNLSDVLLWYRQLWNESLGKQGEGTFLLTAKGSMDQHSQLQMWLDGPNNGLYTFINVKKYHLDIDIPDYKHLSSIPNLTSSQLLKVMSDSTYKALKDKGRNVRAITINDISVESTTSLMVALIVEVLLVASLLSISPYGQDAVEDIKINTLKKLKNHDSN